MIILCFSNDYSWLFAWRIPTTEEVSENFRKRFSDSLGDIVTFISEERKRLDEDNEEGQGEQQNTAASGEGSGQQQQQQQQPFGEGSSSGKYFRRCTDVLGVQIEVN